MWLSNVNRDLVPSFVGETYSRQDFVSREVGIPNTYGLDSLSVYVSAIIPLKSIPSNYFSSKGIILNQTIAASTGLTLTTLQRATGVNELVPINLQTDDSDELTHFYILSNTLDAKQVTLSISFTGVTSLDAIKAFIVNDFVLYQEGLYNVPRLVPFDSLTTINENAVITQHIDTFTDTLYINSQTSDIYVYKRIKLSDLPAEFSNGNFDSLEDRGIILNKELFFNGKGFVVTDEYVFIIDKNVY